MFTAAYVTRDLKSPATGIDLRILHTLMFTVIAERSGVQGSGVARNFFGVGGGFNKFS